MQFVSPPDDLLCSICKNLFTEPVIASDGNSYDRSCINEWFRIRTESKLPINSPLTNLPLSDVRLTPNHLLKSQCSSFRQKLMSRSDFMQAISTGNVSAMAGKLVEASFLTDVELAPLHHAVHSNQLGVLKFFIDQCKADANVVDSRKNNLIHTAVTSGNLTGFLPYLLEKKININAGNNVGDTPLLLALSTSWMLNVRVRDLQLRDLLHAGADVTLKNTEGETVLHRCHTKAQAELFVAKGVSPDAVTSSGYTVFHRTWFSNDIGWYQYLLDRTKNSTIKSVSLVDKVGYGLLFWARLAPPIVSLLLAPPYSLDPNSSNSDGNTIIHKILMNDEKAIIESIKLILGTGRFNINAQNKDGKTALHAAVERKYANVVAELLSHGANPRIPNNLGVSAYDDLNITGLAYTLYEKVAQELKELKDEKAKAPSAAAAGDSSSSSSSSSAAAAASANPQNKRKFQSPSTTPLRKYSLRSSPTNDP